MPSVSPEQRRFFFATKGAAWTKSHHFDVVRRKYKHRRKPKHTKE
jgi:hypothetical protein